MINFCPNSCQIKTSTWTTKRAERARWRTQEYIQETDKPTREKQRRKNQSICEKNINFQLLEK